MLNFLKNLFYLYLVDATDAGSGNLEIAVSRDGKNIPNYVQNEGSTRFRIKFTPDQPCIHEVRIKFNGVNINGKIKRSNELSQLSNTAFR